MFSKLFTIISISLSIFACNAEIRGITGALRIHTVVQWVGLELRTVSVVVRGLVLMTPQVM